VSSGRSSDLLLAGGPNEQCLVDALSVSHPDLSRIGRDLRQCDAIAACAVIPSFRVATEDLLLLSKVLHISQNDYFIAD
jgi:hypothetical protein